MLRKLLRHFLALLTKIALQKHQAVVVAVVGDGPSAIMREFLFQGINLTRPAVKNVEAPNAEFSVPLTVLGARGYPTNYWQWLKFLAKTLLRLAWIKPFSHVLILEVTTVSPTITNFWLQVLRPKLVIDVSGLEFKQERLVEIACSNLEKLGVDSELAKELLSDFYLPEARVSYMPGPKGSLIIDATHFFYPPNWESVLDIVEDQGWGDKILLTDKQQQSMVEKTDGWSVNPTDLHPQADTVIVLRGYGPLVNYQYRDLLK